MLGRKECHRSQFLAEIEKIMIENEASFIKAGSSLHFFPVGAGGILCLTQRHKGHRGTKKITLTPESVNRKMKDAENDLI